MRSYINHGTCFYFAVGSKIQSQVHVKGTGPNIVGMPPLSYNIRKAELQSSTFQSSSRRTVSVSPLVIFFGICYFFVLLVLYGKLIGSCK